MFLDVTLPSVFAAGFAAPGPPIYPDPFRACRKGNV